MGVFCLAGRLLFRIRLLLLVLSVYQWWRDVVREGMYLGLHTFEVVRGLRRGMVLFIVSEVMFFFSFFWAFFHSRLSPTIEVGSL